jgi:phytoene dehydrogenase-like protein
LENKLGNTGISGELKKIISLCLKYATPLCPSSGKLPFLPLPFDSKTSYYPKGGMSGFKKLIEERLEERGVHIERGRRLEEIVIQKKCVTKIKFEDDEGRVSAKAMIFNSIPAILPSMLPQSFFTKKFRRQLSAEVRWGRWQTIFFGIESEKIPVGMDDNLVVDVDEKFPLLFQIVPEEDKGITPQKKRLIKVSWPVEEGEKAEDDARDFVKFEKKVIKKIEELMPFIDNKFEIIYRYDSEPASSEDYILSGAMQTPPGIGVLSPLTPYKNLIVSGREMMPVLGIEGEFLFAEIISNYIYKIISGTKK